MNKLIFIIGGAKSGKSNFALRMANECIGPKAYLATAQCMDDEMLKRIERHRRERSAGWDTVEEPIRIQETLKEFSGRYRVVLLDCLTLWLSNLIHNHLDPLSELEGLIKVMKEAPYNLYIVSNEVGGGIVPENELSRRFRDLAGEINQRIAEISNEVYTVVAGIPHRLK